MFPRNIARAVIVCALCVPSTAPVFADGGAKSAWELRDQVRRVVDAMYDARGGLMISGSVWERQVPLANIDALCGAIEECCWP
jgi:hypothetical protein